MEKSILKTLPPHEWLIIALLIAILTLLSFATFLNKNEMPWLEERKQELHEDLIQVGIKGAVKQTGIHELKRGSTLQDLLDIAQPLPEADMHQIKLQAKLRNNQMISIPQRRWILVSVKGAVIEPKSFKVRLGTTLQELSSRLAFLPDADIEKMQKKRKLKDKEEVIVPVKKIKRKKN